MYTQVSEGFYFSGKILWVEQWLERKFNKVLAIFNGLEWISISNNLIQNVFNFVFTPFLGLAFGYLIRIHHQFQFDYNAQSTQEKANLIY